MMGEDWKAALEKMKGELPEAPAATAEEQQASDQKPRKKEKLSIAMERKGRGGKTATIIYGFADTTTDEEIAALAKRLKQRLGSGGSVAGGEILLQGDLREKVKELLKAEGYRV